MPNPLFNALHGAQNAQQTMPDPAAYRREIEKQMQSFQQQGRNPSSELEQMMQRSGMNAQQQQFIRNLGHAVASRLFGGNS